MFRGVRGGSGDGLKITTDDPTRYGFKGSGRRFTPTTCCVRLMNPANGIWTGRTAKLYLYPKNDLTDSSVDLAMQTEPLFMLDDVSYVDIQALNFSNANGYGIRMRTVTMWKSRAATSPIWACAQSAWVPRRILPWRPSTPATTEATTIPSAPVTSPGWARAASIWQAATATA